MRVQQRRRELNIEQTELARRIGTNAPMMINFENYKCLPIPTMLKRLCKVLDCDIEDIYDRSEIYIDASEKQVEIKARIKKEPKSYKLTVRLPDTARKVLSQQNLIKV